MATQELRISGSEVARRLNIDRLAVSRAVQRARKDSQLMAGSSDIWKLFKVLKKSTMKQRLIEVEIPALRVGYCNWLCRSRMGMAEVRPISLCPSVVLTQNS
jgi:hypothetical protein